MVLELDIRRPFGDLFEDFAGQRGRDQLTENTNPQLLWEFQALSFSVASLLVLPFLDSSAYVTVVFRPQFLRVGEIVEFQQLTSQTFRVVLPRKLPPLLEGMGPEWLGKL